MKRELEDLGEESVNLEAPTVEEMIKARKITISDIRDHISGPTFSIIVHLLILAFLSTVIVARRPKESKELEIKMIKMEPPRKIKKIEPPKVIPDPIDSEPEIKMTPNPQPEHSEPDLPPVKPTTEIQQQEILDVPILKITPSAKVLPFPAAYSNRTGKNHDGAVGTYHRGGDPSKVTNAILKGLRWLKAHQNPDGSWGDTAKNNFSAYTGLALLAYLGYGATPASPEFGSTVLKAIKSLLADLGPDGNGIKGGYRHAIALYALSEACAMTRIPMLEKAMDLGTAKIVAGQNSMGSFNYGYDNSKGRCDLSVSGWNYQALKSAFAAGCVIEGIETSIDKSVAVGLKQTHFANPGFKYSNDNGSSSSMTAVGTLCLELMEGSKTHEVKSGLQILETPNNFWCSWKGYNGKVNQWSLYQWYYQTQAIFQGHAGKGPAWRKWDKKFSKEFIRNQKRDGRWETPAYESNIGSGGEGKLSGLDQPVYATALCCLTLEVYFRYLPSYHVDKTNSEDDGKDALGLDGAL